MKNYEITPAQQSAFRDQGFLRLSNALPADLLSVWQNLLAKLNEDALKAHGTSASSPNACFIDGSDQPLLVRFNDLLAVYPNEVLDLLACPAMMAISRDLCGADSVPLQCDSLFKHKLPESTVLWHQDALHPRTFPYLNIGIYLDDAEEGDGCLEYVPKSQHETQDICKLVKEFGWDIPGKVSLPAKAGDILIQDMMVLHGSQLKQKEGVRRTIYVEMRPVAALLEHGVNSAAWIELRKRWRALVIRRSNVDSAEESLAALPTDLKSDAEEIKPILDLREAPLPAHYCYEPIHAAGYPY